MPDGEFEYVKPPHFYIDKEAEEEIIHSPKITKERTVSTANPLMDGDKTMEMNETENADYKDNVKETLHTFPTNVTPSNDFDPEAVSDEEETVFWPGYRDRDFDRRRQHQYSEDRSQGNRKTCSRPDT